MEDFNASDYAPYAPVANILMLIHRSRERGLPEVLDHREIVKLGIPEESSPRVRKALQFLDFIDAENKQTSNFQRLGRATDDEYPQLLKAILENAYTDVFQSVGDVALAQEKDFNNAFRYYNPQGQRPAMIRLFMALCQDAGLLAEGAVTKVSVKRTPRIAVKSRGTSSKDAQETATVKPSPASDGGFSRPNWVESSSTDSPARYQLMQVLLKQLPDDGIWTQKRHDQWLKAVETSVDLLIEITEPQNENQNRPQQPELEM